MAAAVERLSHIDEHTIAVEASPESAWDVLLGVVDGATASPRAARIARLLGCADTAASGPRPLAVGSAIAGFHVAVAEPAGKLALLGGHRFSEYALIFRLERTQGGTRVRAETRAEFPGIPGTVYRALVIGTRGHVLVVRRLLGAVKRRAERGEAGG